MRFNYFVPRKYPDFVRTCFRIFNSGEPGVYLFPPKTDRERRIDQLIQNYSSDFPLIKLELVSHTFEEIEDLKFMLEKKMGRLTRKKVGVFIVNVEQAIVDRNFALFDSIVKFQEESPNIRFIFFSEIDLTYPEIAKNFLRTNIFSNIVYYPLYDSNDTKAFIDYLLKKWSFEIKEEIKKKIISNCGGHFWLVKQAVRALRDNQKLKIEEILNSSAMRFRLEQIYLSFLENEQRVLKKLIAKEKINEPLERHSLIYLEKLNITKKREATMPILEKYIRQNLPKINIKLINNRIFINEIHIDNYFSKNERRVFKTLLLKKNQIITRDRIAKAIWPINTENYYSDWAVDRIIFRLREKLKQLSLAKEIIKTIRSQGYIFTQ